MSGPRESRTSEAWQLERQGALAWASCLPLVEIAGVGHAFSTRLGPGGDFDLGPPDESGTYGTRHGQLLAAAGLHAQPLYPLRQVHGREVAEGDPPGGQGAEADAVVRHRDDSRLWALAVRTADCVPILIADARGGRVLAAVHAGWRGTAACIAVAVVGRLTGMGVPAPALVAALGPSIGPCCYEVGDEVAALVAAATGVERAAVATHDGVRTRVDLAQANRLQLEMAGVPAGAIHVAPWCTSCREDLFFSYRRDGPTGRLLACIGWRPRAA